MEINLSLGSALPTKNPFRAMELGVHASDPVFGPIGLKQVQLCPQNGPMQLTESVIDELQETYPNTTFRLHANARLLERPVLFDLGSMPRYSEYKAALVRTLKVLKSPYSIHAAIGKNAPTPAVQFGRLKDLEDAAGVPIGLEGLYPGGANVFSTWADYALLLDAGVHFAVDLSHLNIIRHHEGPAPDGLVEALLIHPLCMEVHLSGNDGRRDSHEAVKPGIWWEALLGGINKDATVFYEGRQRHVENINNKGAA